MRFVGVSRAAIKVGSKWSVSYLKQRSSENKLSCKILRKGWVTSFRGRKAWGRSPPSARTRQPGLSVGQWMLTSFLPAVGKWDSQKGCILLLPLFIVLGSSHIQDAQGGKRDLAACDGGWRSAVQVWAVAHSKEIKPVGSRIRGAELEP